MSSGKEKEKVIKSEAKVAFNSTTNTSFKIEELKIDQAALQAA